MRRISGFLLPVFLFFGCHQDPSATGIGVLPPEDLVNVVTFDSQSDSGVVRTGSFFQSITSEGSPFLSVGRVDGYSANALMRWLGLPDTVNNSGTILSATITLTWTDYHIGNSAAPLSLELRNPTGFWSSFTFRSDSLQRLPTVPVPGGNIQVMPADTTTVISLDTNLVRSWLRLAYDRKFSDIHGVMIIPGQSVDHLRAFFSSEGSRPPVLSIRMLVDGKDTTYAGVNLDDTYVATGPEQPRTSFTLQGGLAYRGRVWFDLSRIPAGSTINYARLELTANRQASRTSFRGIDSLFAVELIDTTDHRVGSTLALSRKGSDPDVFGFESFTLTRLVQRWLNNRSTNFGLSISRVGETSDIDLLELFDASSEQTKRPRLKVTYTRVP